MSKIFSVVIDYKVCVYCGKKRKKPNADDNNERCPYSPYYFHSWDNKYKPQYIKQKPIKLKRK